MDLRSTAIICAYNEQDTIANILKNVCDLHFFNEVIVINDGSQDKTGELIKELKKIVDIRDAHLLKNMGKGFAMARGAELSNNKYLVFIDADLSNFSLTHARELLNPVLTGEADMVLGQPTKTLIHPKINPFRNLSGQRALKKSDILSIIEKMKTTGYGVETLINMHYKATNKKVKYVHLIKLVHPTKFHKSKPPKAIKEFVQEGFQIMTTTLLNLNLIKKANKKKVSNILNTYN